MGVDGGQALQGQYTAKWLELKHALTAKYFSNKDLAGSCACMQDHQCLHIKYALTKPLQSVTISQLSAGSINDEVVSVAGVDVRLACEPPLKRFLKTPRLKEDLAKCVFR